MNDTRPLMGHINDDVEAPTQPSEFYGWDFWIALLVFVVLRIADQTLVVVLFDVYGETYAQFLNQGTAFVYIIVASVILIGFKARSRYGAPSLDEKNALPAAPWYVLVCIGALNGSGNFCMGISQPHTPGLSQTLLYLLDVPLVLILSWVCLRKPSSKIAIAGALLIVVGTAFSGLRVVVGNDAGQGGVTALWYSVLLFAVGQIFLSGEMVFEEHTFKRCSTGVMTMFWVTLTTQFMLGWFLYPIQILPAFGGLELADIPSVIWDGCKCTVGITSEGPGRPHCDITNPAIFFVYCAVDFTCYAYGLWVIRRYGANLTAIATGLVLPLNQVVMCVRPLMQQYTEEFYWTDGVALAAVLVGFLVYEFLSPEGKKGRGVD